MKSSKIYNGKRLIQGKLCICRVQVVEDGFTRLLATRTELITHSEVFDWGYEGSGPAQTALAILCDCLGEPIAFQLYETFKREFVSLWQSQWDITAADISQWALNKLQGKSTLEQVAEFHDSHDDGRNNVEEIG